MKNPALSCAALARRIQRAELLALEAFVAIVGECASGHVAKGKPTHLAYRNALNDALDLIREGVRRKEKNLVVPAEPVTPAAPHHD